MSSFPKITHAIFDMDGLLTDGAVDSERVYTQVTNEILGRYGHQLTWEIKSGVMGRVAKEACQYVLSHYPDVPLTVDEYFEERTRIQNELWKSVPLMAGAGHLVKSLHAQGVPIALATGSSYANLLLKTGHLQDVFGLFPKDCIICADSEQIAPGRGKPQPDIFLVAAQTLGLDVGTAFECSEAQKAERAKCVVFEDAIPGVKAGVAADMNVIWVPDENLRALDPDNTYGAAQILKSLEEWKPEEWGLKPFPPPP